MHTRELLSFFFGILLIPLVFFGTDFVIAESDVQKIKKEISQKNQRLLEIEAEIAAYEKELSIVGSEKNTLQRAINQLDLERKKVNADVQYTENQIFSTDLEIDKLEIEVTDTQRQITQNQNAIKAILRKMNKSDSDTLLEIILRQENLSSFWNEFSSLETIKNSMMSRIAELSDLKNNLESKKELTTQQKLELTKLKNNYIGQKDVLVNNKEIKAQLLSATRNEEAGYQKLLDEKEAARETFERQLLDLESQLQFILDPNSIPLAGSQVFRWPLKNPRITQYFGNTAFSRSGAYNGQGHNGMDMGAPRGTPISVVLSGTVIATNVQTAYMCQYGKWVLVRHANGITTLYAHMSAIAAKTGDTVTTGDVIGYVGDTGYSTGPHLHLTAYASEAVTFKEYTCNSGTTLTIPVSATTGYLNPLDFMPPL